MLEIAIMTLFWGFLIGIIVSAPMGPTGILVIQRSLNRGWLAGYLTGLGAVMSDLFYAVLSTFLTAVVVDWISQYQVTLQIVGSLAIMCYAIYLWNSNPASGLAANDRLGDTPSGLKVKGILKYFFSGFFLTISNPAIVFLYMILFARTNFLFAASSENWWLYLIGFLALIGGAVCWWTLITWIMKKVRNHFKPRALTVINRTIAIVLGVIALYGFGYAVYLIAQ